MASWKIGYPSGLDSVANEDDGIALYDGYGIDALTLDSGTPATVGGQATSVVTTTLTDTGNFVSGAYDKGWLKMRSGAQKGEVYKITSNTANALSMVDDIAADGVLASDYYEVISGSTTFEFPTQRNPNRKDYKRTVKGFRQRFPYYEGGIDIPLGFEADDIVIMAFLENETQLETLELLLNQKMDYSGFDGNFTSDEAAPLIIEQGSHTAAKQLLASFNDMKKVKDGARGGFIEIMIHFENIGMPLYRGI